MNATTSTESNQSTERNTTRERILRAAGWLVGGLTRHDAVVAAMMEYQVSLRTAQVYVQKAANRLAREAEYDDPLFAMKLSQLQRDRLLQQLQNVQAKSYEMEPHEIRSFMQTVLAQLKVLDSRDRTAAKIAQLEAKHGRASTGRRQKTIETLPSVRQAQERSPDDSPARPETMPAAAQVTAPLPCQGRPKSKRQKEIQPAAEPSMRPAPVGGNCALKTSAVANAACESVLQPASGASPGA